MSKFKTASSPGLENDVVNRFGLLRIFNLRVAKLLPDCDPTVSACMIQVDSKLIPRVQVTKLYRAASRGLPVRRARGGTRAPRRPDFSDLVLRLPGVPGNPRTMRPGGSEWSTIRLEVNQMASQRRYSARASARIRSFCWSASWFPGDSRWLLHQPRAGLERDVWGAECLKEKRKVLARWICWIIGYL